MIFDDLEKELKNFDYTYMMSDDHSVWVKGESEERRVQALVSECASLDKGKTRELVDKYKQKVGTIFLVH